MNRILGGSPLAVLLRLIVLSVVVGIVLDLTGVSPEQVITYLRDAVLRLYQLGFDAFDKMFRYFLLGAAIVVPLWIISRLWRLMAGDGQR